MRKAGDVTYADIRDGEGYFFFFFFLLIIFHSLLTYSSFFLLPFLSLFKVSSNSRPAMT